MYVDYLMEVAPQKYIAPALETRSIVFEFHDDRLYDMISDFSNATGDLAFISSPEAGIYCISGISHFLKKHSEALGEQIFTVLDVVENRTLFSRTLDNLSQPNRITICIGEENILPELESCSLMVADTILG